MRQFLRFHKKVDNQKGFTLIEFILYIGLFSIFLVLTLELFSSIFEIQIESESTSSVNTDGKYMIQRFSYDVNRATQILTPSENGTNSTVLSMVIDGEVVDYYLDSGNLILENETAVTSDQLNSSESSVSDVSFIKLDGGGKDTVQITFTLTSEIKRKGIDETRIFKTSAGLR